MKRLAVLVALAACGAKANGPVAPAGFQTAPEYASLFQKDAAWTFTVESDDDVESETSETGFEHVHDTIETDCRVIAVGQFDGGLVSQIACDQLQTSGITDPLSGLWIADATGVYHQNDVILPAPGEKPAYEQADLIFLVPPAERSDEETDPEFEDPVSETSVTRNGDAWCYSWTTSMGDAAWKTLCLGVDGPINGSFGWSGGTSHEATFQRKL